MLITYAIAKCYVNNSGSDSNSGNVIMKMVKTFHVDRQADTRSIRFD